VSTPELKQLLDQVADTREIVLRGQRTWSADYDAWRDACEDTWSAYRAWRATGSREAYLAYRAAQDREDAAQATLAQTQMSRTSVS
jgi:hypothetical protein